MSSLTNGSPEQFEMLWKNGTDPREGAWPGLRCNKVEHVDGMEITWDVAVPLRDGTKIYVDIFKPEHSSHPLPVLMTWSPYGKHGPKTFDIFPNSGVPKGSVSKYAVWEGPDPLYWTKKGYAMINGDSRGSWASEGNLEILGPQQAQDGYDVIEWAGGLPWSNGRVGLAGVSYLAIVQWRIAELKPPHLACINPWEGYTDVYRDYSHHGGVPETNFVKFTEWSCRCSLGLVEDWVAMQRNHHLLDNYQASKNVDLSRITVPAYVVADWGDQGLHTRGTLIGFTGISSEEKWLEIHGRKKWQYYYQESSLHRQESFYQKFLKEQPSDIDSWPRVQMEVRDRAFEGTVRAESEWPLSRAQHIRKYLDVSAGQLTDSAPQRSAEISYDPHTVDGSLSFTYHFTKITELTGSMCLRLWVSTTTGTDMDLFVQLDKVDSAGQKVPFIAMSMIEEGPLALGWLRASHRELDLERSTPNRPWLLHSRELPLRPGEVVPVDIEIWPSSTKFQVGGGLRVTICGVDIFRYGMAQVQLHEDKVNQGRHSVYSGGCHESYLVMPYID